MNNILADAINYYDSESLKFLNLLIALCSKLNLKINKELTIDNIIKQLDKDGYMFFSSDLSSNTFTFKDTNKIYIRAKYFYLGLLNKYQWYWYWVIECKKNMIYKSQQILRYGLDIDLDSSDNNYYVNLMTRGLLINGKIEISVKTNEIFLLKALSLYITNSNAVIEIKPYDSNLKEILVLYDIEEVN